MSLETKPFPWNYCPVCGTALALEHDGEKERRPTEIVLGLDLRAELEGALDGRTIVPPDGVEQTLIEREGLGVADLTETEGSIADRRDGGGPGGRWRRSGRGGRGRDVGTARAEQQRRAEASAAKKKAGARAGPPPGDVASANQAPASASLMSGPTICMPGSSLL